MSEKSATPEEKRWALQIIDYIQYQGIHGDTTFVFDTLVDARRDAVAAERKRAAKIAERADGEQSVHLSIGSQIAAAIRAEPDEQGANPTWGATTRRVENEGGENG